MFILAFKETHFRMCECLVVIVGLETYKSLLICKKTKLKNDCYGIEKICRFDM